MVRLPDSIDCPRLTLRRWRVSDAPALGAAIAASVDHLRPWMPWVAFEPLSEDDRRALIDGWEADWAAGGDAVYGAFLESVVVGGCGLHRRAGPDTLDLGYWIHVDHVRRGFASELATGLTAAAFDEPGIERVAIHHDRANVASRGVPERLGFACDGESPDEARAPAEVGIDVAWSIDRDEWERRPIDDA